VSVIETLKRGAGGLAGSVERSVRRARLEGELRVLQRRRDTALAHLGERTFDLIREGRLAATELAAEIADVESKLMEIDAKERQIEDLRDDEEPVGGPGGVDEGPVSAAPTSGIRRRFRRR
jgi:hypothetical protein